MTKRTWYTTGVLMTIAMVTLALLCFWLALSGKAPHWILTAVFWVAGLGAVVLAAQFIFGMVDGYRRPPTRSRDR